MTVNEVPVGGSIVFGNYHDDPIVWVKLDESNLMITKNRLEVLCYDEQEYHSDSRARRSYGNNFFPESNICQWLNSDRPNWWVKTHENDEYPYYHRHGGFLNGFTKYEQNALTEQEISIAVPLGSRKKYGKVCTSRYKVVLPSASQLGLVMADGQDIEGEPIEGIFNYIRPSEVMTRTWTRDAGHIVCYEWVDASSKPCNHSQRVYPMIRLSGDTEIEEVGTDRYGQTAYYVKSSSESTMEEFLNLLNAS